LNNIHIKKMNMIKLIFKIAGIAILVAFAGLIILILPHKRDMTKYYPIKKGEIIVLNQPYHFIDNPGDDDLIPETNRDFGEYKANSKGIVPKGTKVKFLGVYAENGFMVDTKINTYGLIMDGIFRNRKVDLHYVIIAQEPKACKALPQIERIYFSNK